MTRYAARRILSALPVLLGISLLSFLIVRLAPGDPVSVLIPPEKATPEAVLRLQNALGLNRPIYVQYWLWLKQVLTGDLGSSFVDGQPVLAKILELLPNTLLLTVASFVAGELIAIVVGVISARRRRSAIDHVTTVVSFFGIAVPPFWLAMMLILAFALKLRWLPSHGLRTMGAPPSALDTARHLVMPVFVLAFGSIASTSRYVRSSLVEVLGQDYIRTARAKGLDERAVVYRHGLKNSLLPVITIWGLSMPALVAGAFTIEVVFALPGMGRLLVEAINSRDYPVIMGVNLLASTLTVVFNLAADLLYAVVDPRIKFN